MQTSSPSICENSIPHFTIWDYQRYLAWLEVPPCGWLPYVFACCLTDWSSCRRRGSERVVLRCGFVCVSAAWSRRKISGGNNHIGKAVRQNEFSGASSVRSGAQIFSGRYLYSKNTIISCCCCITSSKVGFSYSEIRSSSGFHAIMFGKTQKLE